MDILQATKQYEDYLSRQITLIPADLESKHELMAEEILPFLRATFYRWIQVWPVVCPQLDKAPQVLGVGDLHKELDEFRLLKAMGFETANIHLGSRQAISDIQKDLQSRPSNWLLEAAKEMARITAKDWEDWRKEYK